MTQSLKSLLCRMLAVAIFIVPFQTSHAGMIGTQQAASTSTSGAAESNRSVVLNYLQRAQTVSEFQSLGLDTDTAKVRVAAMSDSEVDSLAGKINSAPAGSDGIVLLVLVVFFIWYFAFRR